MTDSKDNKEILSKKNYNDIYTFYLKAIKDKKYWDLYVILKNEHITKITNFLVEIKTVESFNNLLQSNPTKFKLWLDKIEDNNSVNFNDVFVYLSKEPTKLTLVQAIVKEVKRLGYKIANPSDALEEIVRDNRDGGINTYKWLFKEFLPSESVEREKYILHELISNAFLWLNIDLIKWIKSGFLKRKVKLNEFYP